MEVYIFTGTLIFVVVLYLLWAHFCCIKEQNSRENILNDRTELDKLQIMHNNVQTWIENEKPYQHMTEYDKNTLPTIGISINAAARRGKEDPSTQIFDRLLRENVLKEDLVVYRGVDNQDYERNLAKERELENNYLYYDGYIYCSLNADTTYWNRSTRMIIFLPADSHYLFTGEFSNTPESDEIILDKSSILQIDKELNYQGKHYMWATLVNGG